MLALTAWVMVTGLGLWFLISTIGIMYFWYVIDQFKESFKKGWPFIVLMVLFASSLLYTAHNSYMYGSHHMLYFMQH